MSYSSYYHFLETLWQASRKQHLLVLAGFFLVILSAESAPNLYPVLTNGQSLPSLFTLLKQPVIWQNIKNSTQGHFWLTIGFVIFALATLVILYTIFVAAQNLINAWVSGRGWVEFRAKFFNLLKINLIFTVLLSAFFFATYWLMNFTKNITWAQTVIGCGLIIIFFVLYAARRLSVAFISTSNTAYLAIKQGIDFLRHSWLGSIRTFITFQIVTLVGLAIVLAFGILLGILFKYLLVLATTIGWAFLTKTVLLAPTVIFFVALAWVLAKITVWEWLVWLNLPTFSTTDKK